MSAKSILFVAQAHTITPLFSKFKEAGVEAGIADSLAGALAFLKKTQASVVFTQAKIGGAYQAAQLLNAAREAGDFPPVIVFTDRGTAQEAQALLEMGARDYWLEPLLWDKIAAVLPDEEDARPRAVPPMPGLQIAGAECFGQQGQTVAPGGHVQDLPGVTGAASGSHDARSAGRASGGFPLGAGQQGGAPAAPGGWPGGGGAQPGQPVGHGPGLTFGQAAGVRAGLMPGQAAGVASGVASGHVSGAPPSQLSGAVPGQTAGGTVGQAAAMTAGAGAAVATGMTTGPAAGAVPGQAVASVSGQQGVAGRSQQGGGVTGERFAIIGGHPAILRVLALARQVAKSKATVLVSGESGTGKEMFARFLHAHSDRAAKPFVALNCAALPEHLLESELFGHERGAFTGAIAKKLGKFELASGGTILLDEISEMELGLQAKLLRVLQEGEFDRVGGMETVKVDVRVLATTNRRLEQYVEEGKFRQDLYYRLNVIPLKLPALRERGGDILSLAAFFVDKFRKAYGLPTLAFSVEARDWLLSYDWPGNVRELQNLMERAVLLAGVGPIEKAHFLLEGDDFPMEEEPAVSMELVTSLSEPAHPAQAAGEGGLAPMPQGIVPLDVLEREMILRSLDQTSGNRTQAAQLLGISVRTLRNKLNEYRQQGMVIE